MKVRLRKRPILLGRNGDAGSLTGYDLDALVISSNHRRPSRGGLREGGAFFVVHDSCEHGQARKAKAKVGFDDQDGRIEGEWTAAGVAPVPTSPPDPNVFASSMATLATEVFNHLLEQGAKGYARTRPGNPEANLFVTLGESLTEIVKLGSDVTYLIRQAGGLGNLLRDVREVVRLIRDRGFSSREKLDRFLTGPLGASALPGAYLSWKFGWEPFIRDVQKLYALWGVLDRKLAQLVRESGRVIRRQATLDSGTTHEYLVNHEYYPYPWANVHGAPPLFWGGSTDYTVSRKTSHRTWHSALYRYWVPLTTGSSLWQTRAKLVLFGALISPETLWDLMPWSWLSDWFVNWDDVLSNLSLNAVDGLCTLRAFTMRTEQTVLTATAAVQAYGRNDAYARLPTLKFVLVSTHTTTSKARVSAGPAFLPSLVFRPTASQAAILSAILASRMVN